MAINNATAAVTATVATGMPPGTYCDLLTGGLAGGVCAGISVVVDAGGAVQLNLPARDRDRHRLRDSAMKLVRGLFPAILAAVSCRPPAQPPMPPESPPSPPAALAWTRGAVCYEVFVRSFSDSDGNGIGDLNGLTNKLDYINDGNPRPGPTSARPASG